MKSQGLGVNEEVSFTVNAVDVHAVCYSIDHVVTGGATVPHKGHAGIKMFAQL